MTLFSSSSTQFISRFLRAYPKRSALMIVLLALAGLGEGLGVMALLPLLELASGQGGGEPSQIGGWVESLFSVVGLVPTLPLLLAFIVVSICFKSATMWLAMREVGFTMAQVIRDLRLELVRAVLDARWNYFGRRSAGEFANAISTEAIRSAAAYKQACQMFGAAIQIVIYLGIAFVEAWRVSLAGLLVGAVFVYGLRSLVQMSRSAGMDQTVLARSLTGRLVDQLQGLKPVKAMGREHLFWPLLEKEVEGLNLAHRRRVLASESLLLFQEPIVTVVLAGGLYAAVGFTTLPFSELMVLAFIFYRLMRHFNTLQMRYQIMSEGESAFWSLREAVDDARSHREAHEGRHAPGPLEDGIRFDRVTFGYEDGIDLFTELELWIPSGSFVTLAGVSGVGKTTIVDLIVGLQTPTAGRILIDDVPLSEIDMRAWRSRIGYVPQETPLFNDTILQNVTLGDPDLTPDDAERALRAAGAWEFVSARPDGLHDRVGQGGARLSGGQRQRIAIARALATDPSLLVLDEVTTALDPRTEAEICETLRSLKGHLTVVAISHQPAIQEVADFMLAVSPGRVELHRPLASNRLETG